MGAWLLLQVAYFASVLFLIWRSSRDQSGRQRAKHYDDRQEGRYQSQAYHEGDK
ncbi:exopolysaccharide production repressor protein (plasmid) [Rhizobium gallicum]|nr:exopolysaccharide production repressor protein [Rhizobium gallicum]ULJ74579.1 exopolysaccharide production repressor protein [Rhizobium gallicum]